MDGFTSLEREVLGAMLRNLWPDEGAALRLILAAARVTGRDNTGHDFVTHVQVDETAPSPLLRLGPDGPGLIHRLSAWAEIPALGDGGIMGFVLWARDGLPDGLEGYQFGSDADLKTWDLADLRATRAWGFAENDAMTDALRH